jgi:peptide deformylase
VFFQRNFRLLTYGPEMNNILSKPVEEAEWPEIPRLFQYMVEVMRRADVSGLAAPQVGCFKQFVVIEKRDGSFVGLVNPEIVRLYGKETDRYESCVSLQPLGNKCEVPRLKYVDVEASLIDDPDYRKKLTFNGRTARIIQHELDHLTGTFFIERAPDRKRNEALEKFHNWKVKRRAQIRMMEENGNVNAGFIAACRGQSRVS